MNAVRSLERPIRALRTAPPLLLLPDGEPVSAAPVPLHLRRARLTGVSIEANGGTCRDLLAKRYAAV